MYRGENESRADWPVQNGFRHGTEGHAQATAEKGCVVCHAGIEQSESAATIPVPISSNPLCVNCHIERLFHFPLGSQ